MTLVGAIAVLSRLQQFLWGIKYSNTVKKISMSPIKILSIATFTRRVSAFGELSKTKATITSVRSNGIMAMDRNMYKRYGLHPDLSSFRLSIYRLNRSLMFV